MTSLEFALTLGILAIGFGCYLVSAVSDYRWQKAAALSEQNSLSAYWQARRAALRS